MSRLDGLASGHVGDQHMSSSGKPKLYLQLPPTLIPQGQSASSTFQSSYEVDKPSVRLRQKYRDSEVKKPSSRLHQKSGEANRPSASLREKYSALRDEGRKKNDLHSFAHRSVERDSMRQVGLSSGEISKDYGRSPRQSPPRPRKVFIQNSSALVRREQELLKKGTLTREGSVGTATGTSVTRSLTASVVSASDLTLTGVPDTPITEHPVERDEVKQDEVKVEPSVEEASAKALSDDEDYEEEESDDEREWRKDDDVLNIPRVGSSDDEDQIYEGSCSSTSGYVTEDQDVEQSEDSLEASSMSSLHSSAWRITLSEGENESEIEPDTAEAEVFARLGESDSKIESKTDAPVTDSKFESKTDMPVAVVFEIDDLTDDSQKLSEDGLIKFVKDFTKEMKEETTESAVDKTPSRPSVRIYSAVGAKRSDLKTFKQRVLSSETIVSTILEKRARHDDKEEEEMQGDCPLHRQGLATDLATIPSTHRRKFSKDFSSSDIVEAIRQEKGVEEASHNDFKADTYTGSTEEERKHQNSNRVEELGHRLQSASEGKMDTQSLEVKRERAAKDATDLRELQQRKRATEAKATEILAAAKAKHHAEHRGPKSKKNEPVLNTTTISLREEIERRRQRIKSLRGSQDANSEAIMSRDSARSALEQRRNRIQSLRKEDDVKDGPGLALEQRRDRIKYLREKYDIKHNQETNIAASSHDGRFDGELRGEIERRRERLQSLKESSGVHQEEANNACAAINPKANNQTVSTVAPKPNNSTVSAVNLKPNNASPNNASVNSKPINASDDHKPNNGTVPEPNNSTLSTVNPNATADPKPSNSTANPKPSNSTVNANPNNAVTAELPVPVSTERRKGNKAIKSKRIKHEDSSAGTLTVVTSNRSSEEERKRKQASNKEDATSVVTSRSSKKGNFAGFVGRFLGSKHARGKKSHRQNSRNTAANTKQQRCASCVVYVSAPLRRPISDDRSISSKRSDRSGAFPIGPPRSHEQPSRRRPFFKAHSRRAPVPDQHEKPDSPILSRSWQDCNRENYAEVNTPHWWDKKLLPDDDLSQSAQSEAKSLRIHCSNVHLRSTLEDVDVISFDELGTSTALASASWV